MLKKQKKGQPSADWTTIEVDVHGKEEEDTGKSDGGAKGGEEHDESEDKL